MSRMTLPRMILASFWHMTSMQKGSGPGAGVHHTKALEYWKSVPMVSMMSLPRVTLANSWQASTKSSMRSPTLYSSRHTSSWIGASLDPQSQLKNVGGPYVPA